MKSATWHIITSEYPPQFGGVSDYTRLVAASLAAAGDEVHVWCPSASGVASNGSEAAKELGARPPADAGGSDKGVTVHRQLGDFAPADWRRLGNLLDQFGGQVGQQRRLLVQWVPHGYGHRSMNLPFCFWLRKRAAERRERIELMVHEPYLGFGEGSWKQNGVAAVHRLMTAVLLKAASRVWISIPAWEDRLRPYAFGRALEFCWLPIPSSIPVVDDPAGVQAVRDRYAPRAAPLVGHFGAYDRDTTELLLGSVPALLGSSPDCQLLLLGHGSEEMRAKLNAAPAAQSVRQIERAPAISERVHATGTLSARDVSLHLSACDVLLQPFIDGVSSRRTSVMAGLAHGVPVVTNSGRLTEALWAEREAVMLVPGADAKGAVPAGESLAKATVELLSDKIARRRLGDAGKKLYDERFTIERTVAALRGTEVKGPRSEVSGEPAGRARG